MEDSVTPVINPVPDASQAKPDRVSFFEEGTADLSRSPSSARIAGQDTLTELTGDDIFRMKELRNTESVSASEAAELSQSVNGGNEEIDGTEADENEIEERGDQKESKFDPTATRHPEAELNEEDIFRMKSLSLSRTNALSEQAGQSAVSLVDSASNFDERAAQNDNDDEQDGGEFGDHEVNEQNEEPVQLTMSGQFVFGKHRPENPNYNTNTVIELGYPFEPKIEGPKGVAPEVFRELLAKSKVYICGTAHYSTKSHNDVRKLINEVQPDIVVVELCAQRVGILSMDSETMLREAKNLNRQKAMAIIKEMGVVQGLLQILLMSTTAHITKELGMAPGGEFRAAHQASFHVPGCKLILGDRPISITLQRALHSLNFWQKLCVVWEVMQTNNKPITQEEVEQLKDKDMLEALLKSMSGKFPKLADVFVEERDKYMVYVLQTLLESNTVSKVAAWNNIKKTADYQPLVIVSVVGLGHQLGMQKHWGQVQDNVELLHVPQPTKTQKFVTFTVKAAVLTSLGYLTFKATRGIYRFAAPRIIALIH